MNDLQETKESFALSRPILLRLINANSPKNQQKLTQIDIELSTTFNETLKYIELRDSNCEVLREYCASENLDFSKNYLVYLRLSSFKIAQIDKHLNLEKLLFKITHITQDDQIQKLNLAHSDRLTLIFNFPKNKTVEPQFQKIISYTSINAFDPIDFLILTDSLMTNLGLKNHQNLNRILLIKNGKFCDVKIDDFNEVEIIQTVNWELNETIEEFNIENYYRIFMSPIQNKIFVISKNFQKCEELKLNFLSAAERNRIDDYHANRLLFVTADYGKIEQTRYKMMNEILRSIIGEEVINDNDCSIVISGKRKGANLKYLMSINDISTDEILKFVDDFNGNKLDQRHLISENAEPLFFNEAPNVRRIVAASFRKQVIQNPTSEFILVCKEMDLDCQIFIYFLQILSEKLDSSKVQFGVINAKRNEIETLRVDQLPGFLFYLKHRKHKPEIMMKKFSYGAVLKFVNQFLNRIDHSEINFDKISQKKFLDVLSEKFPGRFEEFKNAIGSGLDLFEEEQEL